MSLNSKALLRRLLETIENEIIPKTQDGVASGSKVFGAAILSRHDLKPLTVATNNERVSPLLHGEINCIQEFFTKDFPDPADRPDPQTDCLFLATHEPCSLCLSGIAWSGFREFYYLFTYEDSRDLFAIPHHTTLTYCSKSFVSRARNRRSWLPGVRCITERISFSGAILFGNW